LRTAGIVDIQTKTGTLNPGGAVTLYGGQKQWIQPSVEFGGVVGQIDYYLTGEYLHNNVGIENPTGSKNAIHDLADQPRGFAYVAGIIDRARTSSPAPIAASVAGSTCNSFGPNSLHLSRAPSLRARNYTGRSPPRNIVSGGSRRGDAMTKDDCQQRVRPMCCSGRPGNFSTLLPGTQRARRAVALRRQGSWPRHLYR
jgi:hypothetical protein